MCMKPFSKITQNPSGNNFLNKLNNFSLQVGRQVKDKDFLSLLDVVKRMNTNEKAHISQVIELFKLILLQPATNYSHERSLSLLRAVKFYLRATTGHGRINHLIILIAYKEIFDEFNLKDVAREFIQKNKNVTRISSFGKI